MQNRFHIAPHWDRAYHVWFAVLYVNGRPDGSVSHHREKAECLRLARVYQPGVEIVDVAAEARVSA